MSLEMSPCRWALASEPPLINSECMVTYPPDPLPLLREVQNLCKRFDKCDIITKLVVIHKKLVSVLDAE